MSASYGYKIESFYMAEESLLNAERVILEGGVVTDPNIVFYSIVSGICGVKFFRLTSTVNYHKAKTSLQSTVARVGNADNCELKPNIISGRQSFLILPS